MSAVYSIIAVDDEQLSLKLIEKLCSANPVLDFIKGFQSAESALAYLADNAVDIVILDIEMPGMNGLDFAGKLDQSTKIIFSTAYEKFALDAFNKAALDYLLKPYSPERFANAIQKAIYIVSLENSSKSDEIQPETVVVQSNYMKQVIPINSITYIESFDDYIKIHLVNDKPLTVRKPLKKMLQELPEKKFVRIHRSYAVAVDKIKGFSKNKLIIGMEELPVSNLYRDELNNITGKLL